MRRWTLTLGVVTLLSCDGDDGPISPDIPAGQSCGVERWDIKTLSDPDAARVELGSGIPTTIAALNNLAARCAGLPDRRISPDEFRVYRVVGIVTDVSLQDDRDYHVVLADPNDQSMTIVTEVADPGCDGARTSPHRQTLTQARASFDALGRSALVGQRVRLTGVAFYDFDHRQRGRSRSCLELHPVIEIEGA